MDAYDPETVFSSIDHTGRYAYGNQPRIAHWNLTRLAEALLPLLAETDDAAIEIAKAALAAFAPAFQSAWLDGLRAKIGLTESREGDEALIQALLAAMQAGSADFTLVFRRLSDAVLGDEAPARALFADPTAFDDWALNWQTRLAEETVPPEARAAAMNAVNPIYIPRNHLVEEALAAATNADDIDEFEALLAVLAHPFTERAGLERYTMPATAEERVLATFCGT
jgi:uncharacterized protein YdiU (UPF0061 family)